MQLFNEVPNAMVVMSSKGMYFESPLWCIGKALYGKDGRFFARLIQDGHTSSPLVRWTEIAGVEWIATPFGVFSK